MFLKDFFDPSSPIYGLVTVIASLGTIVALFLTIHSLNQSRKQNHLMSIKHTLDVLFENLERELEKIIFLKEWAGGTEIHFGRFAIYRAGINNNQILFLYNNLDNFKNYLEIFHMHTNSIPLIISRIGHPVTKRIYKRKLGMEIKFVKDYLKPQLEAHGRIDHRRSSKVKELLDFIDEIDKDNQM